MGNYNPHAPYIIGNEWVPIRDASYEPDQVTERGYTFQLEHAAPAVSGAYYVKEPPAKTVTNVAELIYVYLRGREDKTGPIRRVVIPVSAVGVTGFGGTASGDAESLLNPSDNRFVYLDTLGAGAPLTALNFSVENYSQQLFGKRILGVRLAYVVGGDSIDTLNTIHVGIAQSFELLGRRNTYQTFVEGGTDFVNPLTLVTGIKYIDFSDTNINITQPIDESGNEPSLVALPWRYQELALLSPNEPASTRRSIFIDLINPFVSPGPRLYVGYAALEIFYCEENRVRYGGYITNANTLIQPNAIGVGANFVQLKDVNFNVPSALPAGEYTITHVHREIKPTFIARAAPMMRALRQLYELPSHRGVQVDARVIEDAEFSSETIDELTPLTLHTVSAVITGTHPYGTRLGAPVYGSVTAVQEIEDDPAAGGTYPQVRFYARRFGDTTVPITLTDVATGLSTVSLSVADFDALPEIVDGWREVTLRFATAPTFTATAGDVDWRWTATGEAAYNQWQILAADGPSPSGSQTTGPATYYAPQGANVTLTWQSPEISGTAEDTISDATLIFSQDPPTVTGFAIEATSLEVTGVSQNCGVDPRCVPTAIFGNQLTWNAFGVCDEFERTEVDTWGSTDTDQTWTLLDGVVANYDVSDGYATHTLTSAGTARNSQVSVTNMSFTDMVTTLNVSVQAAGAAITPGPAIGSSPDNMYQARLRFNTNASLQLEVIKRVVSVQTTIGAAVTVGGYTPGQDWSVRIHWNAGLVTARAWPALATEPQIWQFSVLDTSLTAFTAVIARSISQAGNTNTDPVVRWASVQATHAPLVDGSVEIQRRDALTDWQTIMLATRPGCVASYRDFEARVGILSEYRIRTLNALDFAGPWVTGSGTIPAPGVTVGGDANSLLIFTSNQSPTANLAYTMQWEGQPIEQFVFPEADTVQLQRMFGRDFFIAFHPLERGGEQFTRTILVNAAAIPAPSLANFRGLRDLAWADLVYVCVRDELGNRWFANVRVPEASVHADRTIYLAQVQVTEVTDTASPVDPGSVT